MISTPRPSQIAFLAISLAGAILLLIHSFDDQYVDMGLGAAVNPVFFPKILLGFWLVFTGIIALQLFWPGSNRQSEPGNGAARIWPAFAAIALCLLAIWLLDTLGYLIISIPLSAGILLIAGERNWLRLSAVSVTCGIGSWWLFDRLLGIPLPPMPFDGLF
jgi:hypothetical protein